MPLVKHGGIDPFSGTHPVRKTQDPPQSWQSHREVSTSEAMVVVVVATGVVVIVLDAANKFMHTCHL